jgi:hypothetical protein
MQFETWMTEADVERVYKVCTGQLPEEFTTEDELAEFCLVVEHAAMLKLGGEGYDNSMLQ